MKLSNFAAYVKQAWKNKPDTSTPLSAERLRHIEDGIKGNSDAIEAIAAAVVNQIVNDPDKIASMAALYAVNQKVSALDGKVGDTAQLPDGATDVVTAIAKQNSDLNKKFNITGGTLKGELRIEDNYLYLVARDAYSFLMKTDKSGKVVFYNHDFVPIMSLDYTGNLIVKGEIASNRTPI